MATSTHIKGLNLKDEEITEGKRVENLKDYTFSLAHMTFIFYFTLGHFSLYFKYKSYQIPFLCNPVWTEVLSEVITS